MKPTSLPLTRSGAALKTLRPSTLRGSSPRMGSVPPSSSRCTGDRKSTRLNSSHLVISYAVFCLKKKKKQLLDLHTRALSEIDDIPAMLHSRFFLLSFMVGRCSGVGRVDVFRVCVVLQIEDVSL